MSAVYTLGTIAKRYRVQVWQVRRLYERGLLPEAIRIGNYRVVFGRDLRKVERALREAGYLAANLEGVACRK